jgi:hypothetical protein
LKIGKITPQIEMEMVRISTKLSRFLDSLTVGGLAKGGKFSTKVHTKYDY